MIAVAAVVISVVVVVVVAVVAGSVAVIILRRKIRLIVKSVLNERHVRLPTSLFWHGIGTSGRLL